MSPQLARHTGAFQLTVPLSHPHFAKSRYRAGRIPLDPGMHLFYSVRKNEVETLQGRVLRRDAIAVLPVYPGELRAVDPRDMLAQIQDILDTHPTTALRGHIEATTEDHRAWRYTVATDARLAIRVYPVITLTWPGQRDPGASHRPPSVLLCNLMAFLQANPYEWFHLAELARRINSSGRSVTNAAGRLRDQGLLEDDWAHAPTGRGAQRVHIYRITPEGMAWRP